MEPKSGFIALLEALFAMVFDNKAALGFASLSKPPVV
jgi:hypothetical protein